MYKNILIATDGSELASKALDHGLALAKSVGAQVTIVTVSEVGASFQLALQQAANTADASVQFEAAAAAAAQRILDAAEKKAKTAGVTCTTIYVPERHPADGIVETARERGNDLIVMASHGRRGIDRLLLGSQTAEVLANNKVPTLVVR